MRFNMGGDMREAHSGYLIDGHQYLAHTGVQPDVEVWLTRDDVAAGRDTVTSGWQICLGTDAG